MAGENEVPLDPNEYPVRVGRFPYRGRAYHADRVRHSSSVLKLFDRSPLLYREWANAAGDPAPDDGESRSLVVGQALHEWLSAPEQFDRSFLTLPKIDRRTKAGKELYDRFAANAAAAGMTLLTQAECDLIDRLAASVRRNPVARDVLHGCEAESAVQWVCPQTGLALRACGDHVNPGRCLLVDLKTTDDESPAAFLHSIRRYRYDWQAAHYLDGFSAAFDRPFRFLWVVASKSTGECWVQEPDDAMIRAAGDDVRDVVARLAQYRAAGCPDRGAYSGGVYRAAWAWKPERTYYNDSARMLSAWDHPIPHDVPWGDDAGAGGPDE